MTTYRCMGNRLVVRFRWHFLLPILYLIVNVHDRCGGRLGRHLVSVAQLSEAGHESLRLGLPIHLRLLFRLFLTLPVTALVHELFSLALCVLRDIGLLLFELRCDSIDGGRADLHEGVAEDGKVRL